MPDTKDTLSQLGPDTIEKLSAPLDPTRVKVLSTPGKPVYLSGEDVTRMLNDIFGFGSWGYEVTHIGKVAEAGNRHTFEAVVRLEVRECLPVTDVGECTSMNINPESIEMARKGAVTDGLKRCAKHFGDQFGLCLYDDEWVNANVKGAAPVEGSTGRVTGQSQAPEDTAPKSRNAANGLVVRDWIVGAANKKGMPSRPSDKQLGLLNGLLNELVGGDEERHLFLNFVFGGRDSSKNLTKGEVSALIDWMKGGRDPDGRIVIIEEAYKEAQMVLDAADEVDGPEDGDDGDDYLPF